MKGYYILEDSKGNIITEGENMITIEGRELLAKLLLAYIKKGESNSVTVSDFNYKLSSIKLGYHDVENSNSLNYTTLGTSENEIDVTGTIDSIITGMTVSGNEIKFNAAFIFNNQTGKSNKYNDICMIFTKEDNTKMLFSRYRRGTFYLSDGEQYRVSYIITL